MCWSNCCRETNQWILQVSLICCFFLPTLGKFHGLLVVVQSCDLTYSEAFQIHAKPNTRGHSQWSLLTQRFFYLPKLETVRHFYMVIWAQLEITGVCILFCLQQGLVFEICLSHCLSADQCSWNTGNQVEKSKNGQCWFVRAGKCMLKWLPTVSSFEIFSELCCTFV